MNSSFDHLWIIIATLALGSFALRFVFIGFIGDRPLPAWVLRHLRYTAVAILPALVAPAVVWPPGLDGSLDPARLAAAITTLATGLMTRNIISAIVVGGCTLYGLQFVLG